MCQHLLPICGNAEILSAIHRLISFIKDNAKSQLEFAFISCLLTGRHLYSDFIVYSGVATFWLMLILAKFITFSLQPRTAVTAQHFGKPLRKSISPEICIKHNNKLKCSLCCDKSVCILLCTVI